MLYNMACCPFFHALQFLGLAREQNQVVFFRYGGRNRKLGITKPSSTKEQYQTPPPSLSQKRGANYIEILPKGKLRNVLFPLLYCRIQISISTSLIFSASPLKDIKNYILKRFNSMLLPPFLQSCYTDKLARGL